MNDSLNYKRITKLNFGKSRLFPYKVSLDTAKYIYYEYDEMLSKYGNYKLYIPRNKIVYITFDYIPDGILEHLRGVATGLSSMLNMYKLRLPSDSIPETDKVDIGGGYMEFNPFIR